MRAHLSSNPITREILVYVHVVVVGVFIDLYVGLTK